MPKPDSKVVQEGVKSLKFREAFSKEFHARRDKVWQKKSKKISPFKSFHRAYRDDYERETEIPGLMHHAFSAFRIIFRNWKTFLPLILLVMSLNIVFVGLMSEETYTKFQETIDETSKSFADGQIGDFAKSGLLLLATVTTGGLASNVSESQGMFSGLIFFIVWLVTIYLLRHFLAGRKPKLRDGLYNALSPLLSALFVGIIILIQLIPLMIVIITYSAAVATKFLETPFYALVYFLFAFPLVLLSGYLLAGSFLGMVAVTAPGLYPMVAINTAANLIMGRRIKLIVRLIFLAFVLAITWVILLLPVIFIDILFKQRISWLNGLPFIPTMLLFMTIFSFIYFATYSYLFYRYLLDYGDES